MNGGIENPHWARSPVAMWQLLVTAAGVIVTVLLFIWVDRLTMESRVTKLEDGKTVNADAIRANATAIQAEATARMQYDSQLAASLETIKAGVSDIKISIAVLTRAVDTNDEASRKRR